MSFESYCIAKDEMTTRNAVYLAADATLTKTQGSTFYCLCGSAAIEEDITRCAQHKDEKDISKFFSAAPETEQKRVQRFKRKRFAHTRDRVPAKDLKEIERREKPNLIARFLDNQAVAKQAARPVKIVEIQAEIGPQLMCAACHGVENTLHIC